MILWVQAVRENAVRENTSYSCVSLCLYVMMKLSGQWRWHDQDWAEETRGCGQELALFLWRLQGTQGYYYCKTDTSSSSQGNGLETPQAAKWLCHDAAGGQGSPATQHKPVEGSIPRRLVHQDGSVWQLLSLLGQIRWGRRTVSMCAKCMAEMVSIRRHPGKRLPHELGVEFFCTVCIGFRFWLRAAMHSMQIWGGKHSLQNYNFECRLILGNTLQATNTHICECVHILHTCRHTCIHYKHT